MRIRLPFATAFLLLLLFSAYLGFTSTGLELYINDRFLHLLTFFLLTLTIYWIPDTTRRRSLHLSLFFSLSLSLFSAIVQGALPDEREFDFYDIVANAVGSLGAIALSGWYHKRMLERRRRAKGYVIVSGEDGEGLIGAAENVDVELGEGLGRMPRDPSRQESAAADPISTALRTTTLEDAVDNWDENGVDNWDDEHVDSADGDGPKTPSATSSEEVEANTKN